MKRLVTLLMALCMVMGSAVSASAIEVKVSGQMDFVFGYNKGRNAKFVDEVEEERQLVQQRARINVELIASENLRGIFQFQIGNGADWGDAKDGAAMWSSSGGPNISVRRAFIDWNVPDTSLRVKMGYQQITLPFATFDNPMFNNHVAAVALSSKLSDDASLTAFWARPFNNGGSTGDAAKDNLMDSFGLAFSYSGDVVSITPWIMYSLIGNQSGFYGWQGGVTPAPAAQAESQHYAFGAALEFMPTDDLTISLDGMYGSLSDDSDSDYKASGYLLALALEYEMDWGTPGLIAWYASGDDADDLASNEVGRMPVVGSDSGFNPTRMGFSGAPYNDTDAYIGRTGVGTMGIGLKIADMSFVEDLSHTFVLAYIQGTNDNEITDLSAAQKMYGNGRETMYLTSDDSAIEVNFDSVYKIYKGLDLGIELGYLKMNLDHDYYNGTTKYDENAYSAQIYFHYGF